MADMRRHDELHPVGRGIVGTEREFEAIDADGRTGSMGGASGSVMRRGVRIMFVAMFMLVAIGAVVAGVSGLRFVIDADARTTEVLLSHGVLSNAIRGNDTTGFASVGNGPEGDSLVLSRLSPMTGGTYETRIYLYRGNIVQEVSPAGKPYDPDDATRIVESASFFVSVGDGKIHVMTDADSVTVAMRCQSDANGEDSVADSVANPVDEGGVA